MNTYDERPNFRLGQTVIVPNGEVGKVVQVFFKDGRWRIEVEFPDGTWLTISPIDLQSYE